MLALKCLAAIHGFRHNEEGATAIEYGLIAALVVIGMIAGLNGFAGAFIALYEHVVATIEPVLG